MILYVGPTVGASLWKQIYNLHLYQPCEISKSDEKRREMSLSCPYVLRWFSMALRSYTVPWIVLTGSTNILLVSGQIRCWGWSGVPGVWPTSFFQWRREHNQNEQKLLTLTVVKWSTIYYTFTEINNSSPSPHHRLRSLHFSQCCPWLLVRTYHGSSRSPRPKCFQRGR